MSSGNSKRFYLFHLVILLAIIAGYHNTLQSPFVLDDEGNILRNSAIQIDSLGVESLKKVVSFSNPPRTRPLAKLSFALNYLAGGFEPAGFHLVNICIHFLTAIFILRLFVWYLRKTGFDGGDALRLAFLAVLIWALNPIQTNTVTYIVQRMTGMCALFFAASLYFYLQAREMGGQGIQTGKAKRYLLYGASLMSWSLAMLTKEIAAIMPLILLLHEVFFFDGKALKDIRNIRRPFLLGGLVLLGALLVFLVPKFWVFILEGYDKRDFTLTERLLTQSRAVVRYFSLFLAPLPSRLTLFYDYPVSRSLFDPPVTLWAIVFLALLLIGSIVPATRRWKLIPFGILWTLSCLVIESTFIPLEMVFEHRFYLPSVGFSLAVTLLAFQTVSLISRERMLFNLFGACVVLIMVFLTYERNRDWRSELSIYADAANKAPGLTRAVNALGVAYVRAGDDRKAEQAFQRVMRMEPGHVAALANLYTLYSERIRSAEAEKYLARLKQAVAAGAFQCRESSNLLLVAETLSGQERYDDAIFILEPLAACRINQGNYYESLGLCYSRMGNHGKAVANFARAAEIEPGNPYFLFSLARSYYFAGDRENAVLIYERLRNVSLPEELKIPYRKMGRVLKQ